MVIEQKITNPYNYSDKRSTRDIVYIVVQEISNKPTGHYHVKNGNAIQVIPDEFMSDSVNGGKLNQMGRLHGICTKYNSITICVSDNPSKKDIEIIPHLIMTLMRRYKIKDENVIRQKDVTGEYNPIVWASDERWDKDIKNKLADMA